MSASDQLRDADDFDIFYGVSMVPVKFEATDESVVDVEAIQSDESIPVVEEVAAVGTAKKFWEYI